jgi:segregation and condensation protein B
MADVTAVPEMDEELHPFAPWIAKFGDSEDSTWGEGEEEEEWDEEEDEWDEDDEWGDDDEEWDEDEDEDWEEGDWEEDEEE